jgi:hypothetical protein
LATIHQFMKRVLAIAALAAVAAIHLLSAPLTIWEYDENLYAMGVERFEPLAHHPPPPGSPLFIGFGKLIPTDPFHALVFTGLIAVIAGLIVFARAFGEISGDRTAGVVAAILLYSAPALLISGPLPQGDAGALALLGIAIWMCTRGNPFAMGIACAAAIGWRLQFCVAVVPMFIVALWMLRTWRARVQAVVAFGVSCLAWFVPLVFATGGPVPYWRWLTGQAAYYAQHDSDLSRSGYTAAQLFFRFVAHPWGPKWLALPILLFALIAPAFLRVRSRDDGSGGCRPVFDSGASPDRARCGDHAATRAMALPRIRGRSGVLRLSDSARARDDSLPFVRRGAMDPPARTEVHNRRLRRASQAARRVSAARMEDIEDGRRRSLSADRAVRRSRARRRARRDVPLAGRRRVSKADAAALWGGERHSHSA